MYVIIFYKNNEIVEASEGRSRSMYGNNNSNNKKSKKIHMNESTPSLRNNRKKGKRTHTPDVPGARLYHQYMERLPYKEEKMRKLLQEETKENLEDVSFTPKINKNSKRMVENKYSGKIEDKLISYGNQTKVKLQKEVELKKEAEMSKCQFRPQLNKKTKVLGYIKRKIRKEELPEQTIAINPEYLKQRTSKSADVSFSSQVNLTSSSTISNVPSEEGGGYKTYYNPKGKHKINKTTKIYHRNVPVPKLDPSNKLHDFLYIESKLIEEKKEKERQNKLNQMCPFKPNLSQTSKKYGKRKETEREFVERLYHNTKCSQEAKEEEPRISQLKDSITGQKLFKPNILRGPKDANQRNLASGLFDKKIDENQKKRNDELLVSSLEKKKLFYGRSREIIMKMKIEKYKEIFKSLDSDNDGQISSKNICLAVLDQDLLEALTPLFEELQKKKISMNFKDFCVRVDKHLTLKIFTDKDFEI